MSSVPRAESSPYIHYEYSLRRGLTENYTASLNPRVDVEIDKTGQPQLEPQPSSVQGEELKRSGIGQKLNKAI